MKKIAILISAILFSVIITAQTTELRIVSGTISDKNNIGLPGATIRCVETNDVTMTDLNGNYSIVAPLGSKIRVVAMMLETSEFIVTKTNSESYKTVTESSATISKSEDSVKVKKIFRPEIPEDPSKTFSPFIFVKSDNPEADKLPLKATNVDVNIAGIIADVSIKQVYVNDSENVLEAIYIFPASDESAVYAMTMYVGNRKLEAKIKEKAAARKEYEQAKAEGKTASLLEQHRPNVFQMNVANILPGDSIVVELNYVENIKSVNDVYEFVFPTVVGPRYSGESLDWNEQNKAQNSEKPNGDFNINISINAGVPLQFVNSPSHIIDTDFPTPDIAKIKLNPHDKTSLDVVSPEAVADGKWIGRDFIIRYGLRGKQPKSGLLTYEHDDENYFLLMIQPPDTLIKKNIPKREYIFIVDVSGSMNGFPLQVSKKLLKNLLSDLNPEDKFNIMFFAGSNYTLFEESELANTENLKKAIKMLEEQRGGGSTQIYPAFKKALAGNPGEGYSRIFVPITDGYVTVETELYKLVRDNINQANMFAFGIGSSVNRYIINGLAHAGMGEPYIVTSEHEAEKTGKKLLSMIRNPVLTDININYDDFDVYDVNTMRVPDLFSKRSVIIYGKYKGKPKGTITVTGIQAGKKYEQKIKIKRNLTKKNKSLRYLWARNRIKYWDDYAQYYEDISQQRDTILSLGLKYNLLTKYTSFIAVDNVVRNQTGYNSEPKHENKYNVPKNYIANGNNSQTLQLNSTELETVVISALGVSRETKSISYCATSVSSEELTQTKDRSVINSLQGKVAGVNISNSSGSPGSGTNVNIRGNSSVSGNCQPLYIIDGVPINNTSSNLNGGTDFSSDVNTLNPDDIENITILKGENATALYGSRAANGVIIITTKKAKPKKFGAEFSSSLSLDVVGKLPNLQETYSQGRIINGKPTWQGSQQNESFSWGTKISDLEYDNSGNLVQKGEGNGNPAKAYNPYDFFTHGYTANNTIKLSGNHKDKYKVLFTANNFTQKGFIPNSKLMRNTFSLKSNNQFTRKFKLEFKARYTNNESTNFSGNNSYSGIMYNLLTSSPSFNNNNESQSSYNSGITDNPYFSANKNVFTGKGYNFSSTLTPRYKINDKLNILARLSYIKTEGTDNVNFDENSAHSSKIMFADYSEKAQNILSQAFITYNLNLNQVDFGIFAGAEYSSEKLSNSYLTADNNAHLEYIIPKILNFERNKFGGFITPDLSFSNLLFLNLTSRADQNKISANKDVLFSHSASLSFIFTDAIPVLKRYIPYGKIFASYGTKDNDIPLFAEPTYFSAEMFDVDMPIFAKRKLNYDSNLKVENKSTFEIGTNLRFFNSRVIVDFAYFNSKVKNQYALTNISSDFTMLKNAGNINNSGFEVLINTNFIKKRRFKFDVDLNFSKSKNIVSGISETYPEGIVLMELGNFSSRIIEGESKGVFYGTRYLRNSEGEKIIGLDGYPIVDTKMGIIGDPTPDYVIGMSPKIRYYGFTLIAQFDYKHGGDIWNGTKNTLNYFGVSQETANLRETNNFIFEGVTENGETNSMPVSLSGNYWTRNGEFGVAEDAIEDGTWFRMSNLTLSYSINKRYLKKAKISTLKISAYANNVFTITKYSGITPDTNLVKASHGIGVDYFNLPAAKVYGLKLNLAF